jgi:hypothetical protein
LRLLPDRHRQVRRTHLRLSPREPRVQRAPNEHPRRVLGKRAAGADGEQHVGTVVRHDRRSVVRLAVLVGFADEALERVIDEGLDGDRVTR